MGNESAALPDVVARRSSRGFFIQPLMFFRGDEAIQGNPMVTRKFAFELSLTLTLLTARAGYAVDLEGEHGSVASVEISTSSADTYLQYHGELLVLNSATKTLDNYRWDGTSCGARLLTEG